MIIIKLSSVHYFGLGGKEVKKLSKEVKKHGDTGINEPTWINRSRGLKAGYNRTWRCDETPPNGF
jgi:hypothetical protein